MKLQLSVIIIILIRFSIKKNNKINEALLQKFVYNQKSYAERKGVSNIIISSENLFTMPKHFLSALLKAFNLPTNVIVFLKRQDLYLESIWAQWHYKNKYFKDFEDFKKKFKIENYYEELKKWETLVGKDNIIITPFEKSSFPEGLLKHFLTILGIPKDLYANLNFEIKQSLFFDGTNQGLSPKGLKLAFLCRDLAQGPLDYSLEKFINKYFGDILRKGFFESYGLFKSKEDRLNYLKKFESINTQIAKEFLNRDKLFLDEIPEEASDPKFSIEDILKLIMYLGFRIDEQLKNIKKG
jgi:hypothetical protein